VRCPNSFHGGSCFASCDNAIVSDGTNGWRTDNLGQGLQIPFETAIKSKDGGFIQPSIEAMTAYLAKQEKLHGSLFGKLAEYTYGQDESFSIDTLITALRTHTDGCVVEGKADA